MFKVTCIFIHKYTITTEQSFLILRSRTFSTLWFTCTWVRMPPAWMFLVMIMMGRFFTLWFRTRGGSATTTSMLMWLFLTQRMSIFWMWMRTSTFRMWSRTSTFRVWSRTSMFRMWSWMFWISFLMTQLTRIRTWMMSSTYCCFWVFNRIVVN